MASNSFEEYSPAHLERLKYILADIYTGFGVISENIYLVGGLVADLLVKNKLSYLKEYLGTLDIDLALKFAVKEKSKFSKYKDNPDVKEAFKVIPALFGDETSDGVRDVSNILFRRYGLDINFAKREVRAPFNKLGLR